MPPTIFDSNPVRSPVQPWDPSTLHLELHHQGSIEWAVATIARIENAQADHLHGVEAFVHIRQASFEVIVLSLPEGQTEAKWHRELLTEARSLNVPITSAERRQKEAEAAALEDQRRSRQTPRAVPSTDSSLLRGRLDGRAAFALAATPPRQSPRSSMSFLMIASTPSPSRRSRLRRRLSMLRLTRSAPSHPPGSCPDCERAWAGQCRPEYRLACGHILCKPTVITLFERFVKTIDPTSPPTCCGLPISTKVFSVALSPQAYEILVVKAAQNNVTLHSDPIPGVGSRNSSLTTGLPTPALSMGSGISPRRAVPSLPPTPSTPCSPSHYSTASHPDVVSLKDCQVLQKARIDKWAVDMRRRIEARHTHVRDSLKERNRKDIVDTQTLHSKIILDAEDAHVEQEAAVRSANESEMVGVDAAVNQLDALLAGTLITGEPHNRVIDEAAMQRKREKHERRYEKLERELETAVRLLRNKQEGEMKVLINSRDAELSQLEHVGNRTLIYLDHHLDRERISLEDFITDKGKMMEERWDLEVAVLSKKIYDESRRDPGITRTPLIEVAEEDEITATGPTGLMITTGTVDA